MKHIIHSAELVAVGSQKSKKSEKFEDDIWSDIEEPPVDETRMYAYAVIFHGNSHYYFGGYGDSPLASILRLQSGFWTWSNVGQINTARSGHEVISVGEKFMVIGGYGYNKNEACLLNNGQFYCADLSSSLEKYLDRPILFSVADNYGQC